MVPWDGCGEGGGGFTGCLNFLLNPGSNPSFVFAASLPFFYCKILFNVVKTLHFSKFPPPLESCFLSSSPVISTPPPKLRLNQEVDWGLSLGAEEVLMAYILPQ